MATLANGVPTLHNWAKTLDPTGRTARVVEALNQKNPILQDIPYIEGNLPTGHRDSIRTGLPAVAWRLLNQGVQPTTSTETQVDFQCGLMEAWAEVDCELARLNGNTAAFRAMKAKAFIEAMGQEAAQTLFYGNQGLAGEEFTGFSVFYSSLSGAASDNVISGGGSQSDNTSVWLVGWGEDTIHGVFPQASVAGLMHQDLGEETAETAAGIGQSRLRVYRDQFTWKVGLAVKDWRYAVRICNIDVSNLVGESSNADLIKLMSRSLDRPPEDAGVNLNFYCNRTVFSMLRIQALNKSANALAVIPALDQFGNPIGRGQLTFDGIPIRRCDQILNTEAQIT